MPGLKNRQIVQRGWVAKGRNSDKPLVHDLWTRRDRTCPVHEVVRKDGGEASWPFVPRQRFVGEVQLQWQ